MRKMKPTHDNKPATPTTNHSNHSSQDSVATGRVLTTKRVTGAIASVLRGFGWRKQDLPEGIAEVQCRAIDGARRSGDPIPTDPEAAAKLCATIAINWCIDEARRRDKLKGHDEGLCDDPDEYGPLGPPGRGLSGTGRWDPVDMKRMLEQFRALAGTGQLPEHAEQIVVGIAEGKTHEEIGQELGMSAGAVAHRLVEIRTRFKKKLKTAGLLALLLQALVLMALPLGGCGLAVNDDDSAEAAAKGEVRCCA